LKKDIKNSMDWYFSIKPHIREKLQTICSSQKELRNYTMKDQNLCHNIDYKWHEIDFEDGT
jgi:hypothetical protein